MPRPATTVSCHVKHSNASWAYAKPRGSRWWRTLCARGADRAGDRRPCAGVATTSFFYSNPSPHHPGALDFLRVSVVSAQRLRTR